MVRAAFTSGWRADRGIAQSQNLSAEDFHDGREKDLRRGYLVASVEGDEFHVVASVGQQRCELGSVLARV